MNKEFLYSGLKNRGTAIITIILIVAIVSITAITMQGFLRSEINRTQMLIDNDNLYNKLLTAESWGLGVINKATTSDAVITPEMAHLSTIMETVNLTSEVIPQSGLFNVNYLDSLDFCQTKNNSKQQLFINKIFTNLLMITLSQEGINIEQANSLVKNIQQNFCSTHLASNSPEVKSQNPGSSWDYQTGSQLMVDTSELRLVNGVTQEIYNNLKKYITALPVTGTEKEALFNLEYIKPEIFAAMVDIDTATAVQYLANNKNLPEAERINDMIKYIKSIGKYEQQELQMIQSFFTLKSESSKFYIIKSTASKNDYVAGMQSLIVNNEGLRIIWRKRV